ncbi:hypothetical protein KPH14_011498, partial [Odynerus spinipes]
KIENRKVGDNPNKGCTDGAQSNKDSADTAKNEKNASSLLNNRRKIADLSPDNAKTVIMPAGKSKRLKLIPKPNLVQRRVDKREPTVPVNTVSVDTTNTETSETLHDIIRKIRDENAALSKELDNLKNSQGLVNVSQTSVKEKVKKIEEHQATGIPLQNRFEILSTAKSCVSHDPIANVKPSDKNTTADNINKQVTQNIWAQNLKGDSAIHTHNTNSPSSSNALYCVLCNKLGHPASYKGCPRRQELIARFKNKEVELNNKKIKTSNLLAKFATSELSYANALKEKSTRRFNSQSIKESAPSVNEQLVKIHKTVTESLQTQLEQLTSLVMANKTRIDGLYEIIHDCRLDIVNKSSNGNVISIPHDSDHNALCMQFRIKNSSLFTLETQDTIYTYNYNKVNWPKFKAKLNQYIIPNDLEFKNLKNSEIDSLLIDINAHITTSMKKYLPKHKPTNSTDKYNNYTLKKLHKIKSNLLSRLFKCYRTYTHRTNEDIYLTKLFLKIIKKREAEEFKKAINNYWNGKICKISIKDSKKMFPNVNRLFRFTPEEATAELTVPASSDQILDRAHIPKDNLQTDNDNNYIITNGLDKLNLLGAHFEATHTKNLKNNHTRLSHIIHSETKKWYNSVEEHNRLNSSLVFFTRTNPANNPTEEVYQKISKRNSEGPSGQPKPTTIQDVTKPSTSTATRIIHQSELEGDSLLSMEKNKVKRLKLSPKPNLVDRTKDVKKAKEPQSPLDVISVTAEETKTLERTIKEIREENEYLKSQLNSEINTESQKYKDKAVELNNRERSNRSNVWIRNSNVNANVTDTAPTTQTPPTPHNTGKPKSLPKGKKTIPPIILYEEDTKDATKTTKFNDNTLDQQRGKSKDPQIKVTYEQTPTPDTSLPL